MTPLRTAPPRTVGILAIAAVLVLGAVVFRAGDLNFGNRIYRAHFAHTAGLHVGEDVTVAGARVGEVKSIDLGPKDVVVTFTVGDGIRLGADTRADIEVATLLGTHLLALTPKGSGDLADDTIPISATSVPYNLQDIIDRGSASLDELDPQLLSRTLNQVGLTLQRSKPDLAAALDGVAAVSQVVLTRADQADELLRSATSVARRLNANSTEIVDLMRQTNLVLAEIQARRDAIRTLLGDTSRLARTLRRVVTSNDQDVTTALTKLRVVTKALRSQDKQLSEALRVLGPSARYLANGTGNGPWVDARPDGNAMPDGLVCQARGTC